ncbi:enoyl-CoA hydratase/isomerase family protein [bacterium]|jgi:Delta3-Delta2-enoyl-CoA isomerase|nr:enoyl-CoA hydratase/isomerase family protein [bacterium]
MNTLSVETQSEITTIRLSSGRANPIGLEMMRELYKEMVRLDEDESVRGVILTGNPGYFSVGLNVMELASLDDPGLDRFWREFFRLIKSLVGFTKPLICAVSGYAPAGGCVLSLCCDRVLMADGDFRIGLNEIEVGLFVPEPILQLMIARVGEDRASQLVLDSRLLTPGQAQRFGLVHELCSGSELMDKAEGILRRWIKWHPPAWTKTKVELRSRLLESLNQPPDALIGRIFEHWKSPGTQESIMKVVKSLKKA